MKNETRSIIFYTNPSYTLEYQKDIQFNATKDVIRNYLFSLSEMPYDLSALYGLPIAFTLHHKKEIYKTYDFQSSFKHEITLVPFDVKVINHVIPPIMPIEQKFWKRLKKAWKYLWLKSEVLK